MIDMVPTGVAMSGAQGQPLQVAINLASAQSNLASEISFRTMADVARDSLPKLRNTVEFIVIASFPLMLIMVIASGHYAGTMLRTYFVMLLLVQLWAPLYAVLNYLVVSTDTNPFNQLIAAYGGNTISNALMVQNMGSSSAAIAGGLTVLVPVIAYYLASRAEVAATAMASSIMQPAMQASQSMASQVAQGNSSMGNVTWGNVSTNNWSSNSADRSTTWTSPQMNTIKGGYGESTAEGGQLTGVKRTPIDPGATLSTKGEQSAQSSIFDRSSSFAAYSRDGSFSVSAGASSSDSNVANFTRSLASELSGQTGGGTERSFTKSGSSGRSSSEGVDNVTNLANRESGALGGSLGVSAGAKAGGTSGKSGAGGQPQGVASGVADRLPRGA